MVINPNNTTHTLSVIPRWYPSNELTVNLYNEAKKTNEDVTNTYNTENGRLKLTFDYTFIDRDKFQIKISENNQVIYRGKLFATTQETQKFKLTDGKYYY